jgi:tripartite-type tricarboxylate transporter receptor subunit TctC
VTAEPKSLAGVDGCLSAQLNTHQREQTMMLRRTLFTTAVAAAALLTYAGSEAAEDFYAGKTIKFIIGSNPGGGYDIYARTLAEHLVRHLPGNPEIVPMNMPGAGSAKAASYMATIAAKDGTEIGAIFPGAVMEPLLESTKFSYDPSTFQYLGTLDNSTRLCVTYQTSKTKTFGDAQKRKTVIGASQAGGSTRDYAYMLNNLAGAKFDIVSGYKGSVDILIALERGEVEGLCGYDWSSLRAQRPDWVRDHKVNYLLQVGAEPQVSLTRMGVPSIWKFITDPQDRQVAQLIVSQQMFGRPYLAPAGTPPDRVATLRRAFAATIKDPEFLADAKKTQIDIEPLPGEQVQQVVEKLFASPRSVVERAAQVTRPGPPS